MNMVVVIGIILLAVLYVVSAVAAIILAVMNVRLKIMIKNLKSKTEYCAADKSD